MKKIIVAPLNWGLGHASRCIPIITSLLENNFTPVIASDGNGLAYLKKEFPNLESLELPSYNISYAKNLKWSLFLQIPSILKAIKKEHKLIDDFIIKNNVSGITSDNRFGVLNKKVYSVYITHQTTIFSGIFTFLTSKVHQKIIKRFDECWIPDLMNSEFSGKLSFSTKKLNQKFIGVLSRFTKQELSIKIDVLIILSGIESRRIQLEKKLKSEFKNYGERVVLVQGKIESQQRVSSENNIKIYNFMLFQELQNTINTSEIAICRAGYSSIMDLAVLQKRVFFIPTKNQTEQEYLADYLHNKFGIPFSSEENFTLKIFESQKNFKNLSAKETKINPNLFSSFQRK